MIKDKLHTITDEDAIAVARILLKNDLPYNYSFTRIQRIRYDRADGTVSKESVNVYFDAIVSNDNYKKYGWKDRSVNIELIERDRYRDYPYFYGSELYGGEIVWSNLFLANQIEAVEFLQRKQLL